MIGVGEIFGGGTAPVMPCYVAQHVGIECIMHLAAGALAPDLVVALSIKETTPLKRR